MMSAHFTPRSLHDANPLDLVEDIAAGKNWRVVRHDDDLMRVFVAGKKSQYEVCLEWQDEFSSLLFACSLSTEVGAAQRDTAVRAMEQMNQNIWMGHFDLSNDDRYPTFRYNMLCRMVPPGIAADIVADVIEVIISECDRFFNIFQLVQAGDVRLGENMQAALYDTIGEA